MDKLITKTYNLSNGTTTPELIYMDDIEKADIVGFTSVLTNDLVDVNVKIRCGLDVSKPTVFFIFRDTDR